MRGRRRTRMAAGLVALGVVAAACGGDDGGGGASSDEGQEYVDAFVAANTEEQLDLSEEEQECVARALVDAIGVSQLQDAVTPDEVRENPDADPADLGIEVDEEQAEAFWDGLTECVDVVELIVAGMTEDEDISDEAVACLEDEIDEDFIETFFKPLMVTQLVEGDDAGDEALEQALADDEELIGELFGVFAACPGAIDLGS